MAGGPESELNIQFQLWGFERSIPQTAHIRYLCRVRTILLIYAICFPASGPTDWSYTLSTAIFTT